MSARLYYKRVTDAGYQLIGEFPTLTEAEARAEQLSGSAERRAKPSWDSISGVAARGFEYQRGDEIWVVEVDD